MKVEVMVYILDYQGLGKFFSLTVTGSYRGCAWCLLKGQYCKHLSKVVYPGNRRFLPPDHELRKDTESSLNIQLRNEGGLHIALFNKISISTGHMTVPRINPSLVS